MRLLLAILASIIFLSTKAQTLLPVNTWRPLPTQFADSSHSAPKWQLNRYASLSAGYIFFNGGASFISAPIGLQLSHPLNKNVYAFAGVSAAPTFFSFSRLYTQPVSNAFYPGNNLNRYGLGLNGRVEAGLMYINDAKTFSISGSFGVERSSYPIYPTNRKSTQKP